MVSVQLHNHDNANSQALCKCNLINDTQKSNGLEIFMMPIGSMRTVRLIQAMSQPQSHQESLRMQVCLRGRAMVGTQDSGTDHLHPRRERRDANT